MCNDLLDYKFCQYCGVQFYKNKKTDIKAWKKQKYCSRNCVDKARRGTKNSEESKLKVSSKMKGRKNSLGTVRSLEFKQHLSEYWTNNPNHNHYIDGRSSERATSRRKEMGLLPYREWRKSIFIRDNYTCVLCKQRGGKLVADHIKPWALFPEFRYDISNGRTLCHKCHVKTDTYAGKVFSGKGGLSHYRQNYG